MKRNPASELQNYSLTVPNANDKTATVAIVNAVSTHKEDASAKYSVSAGNVTISVTTDTFSGGDHKGVDIKDGFDVTVLGSKFEFRAQQVVDDAKYATTTLEAGDVWQIKVGSKTISNGAPKTAMTFANTTEFANALSVAKTGCTLTVCAV